MWSLGVGMGEHCIQIREDDIDEQYELAKSRGHERRDEGWQEEYDRHGRLCIVALISGLQCRRGDIQ